MRALPPTVKERYKTESNLLLEKYPQTSSPVAPRTNAIIVNYCYL